MTNRVLMTGGLRGIGGVSLRLLGGRDVRTMVRTRVAEVRAMLHSREVQSGARVSFIAANPDDDTRRLDTMAGCEFLDDRIRLRECPSPWSELGVLFSWTGLPDC